MLGLFAAHLALVVVGLFVLDWFVAATPFGTASFDLRSAHVCPEGGPCVSFSLGEIRGTGFYGSVAGLTFWGTLLFTILVAYQAIKRITTGFANDSLSKLGYAGGMILFGNAFAAAFLLGPEAMSTPTDTDALAMTVTRTTAPFLLLIGLVLGIAVLYYAVQQMADGQGEYKPIGNLPVRAPTAPPVAKHDSSPPAAALAAPVKKHSSSPPASALKKFKFVALSAEITRAGIDARREDGSSKLVMWRDVVGLVARRMPPAHDGITFLDVVSTAGSTLRILPWSRVTGEAIDGDGDAWARGVLNAMLAKCPGASLDPATKRFQAGEPAAQLPDLAKLAAHDDKLA